MSAQDVDSKAVELRRQGRTFGKIAQELNLERSSAAIAAFSRSLDRRPKAEKEELLSEELRRLDRLSARVRKTFPNDAKEVARRIKIVERIRALILKG